MAEGNNLLDDLEEDFQSIVTIHDNAREEPEFFVYQGTNTDRTGEEDVSAKATENSVKPGTLSEEANRYKTFIKHGWDQKNACPKASKLSNAGFYYQGVADYVTCLYCKLTLGKWEQGDDPVTEHKKYSKDCPYIKQF